jgi:hypothetical protein
MERGRVRRGPRGKSSPPASSRAEAGGTRSRAGEIASEFRSHARSVYAGER